MTSQFSSVVDVLDAFFGGTWGPASVQQLAPAELDELAEMIDVHYDDFTPSLSDNTRLRVYSGGSTFMNPGNPAFPFLASAVLYADEIVINCPLDRWVYRRRGTFRVPGSYRTRTGMSVTLTTQLANDLNGPGFWESEEDNRRRQLAVGVDLLSELEPAIRAGWLVPVPHLRYWKQHEDAIWSQVRRDVMSLDFHDLLRQDWKLPPADADFVRGATFELNDGYHPRDHARAKGESPSVYFNGVLSIASTASARFLPSTDSDYALLRYKIQTAQLLERQLRDSLLVNAIDHVLAPALDEDRIQTVAAIRDNEPSFDAWRTGLRNIVSGQALPASTDTAEVQNLVIEQLTDLVSQIRKDIAHSSSLRARMTQARFEVIDFGVAAAIWTLPVDTLSKVIGSLAPLLKIAVQSAISPLNSTASVLLQLDQGGITEQRRPVATR